MPHLFVLWLALFAAQATTPATPPPSEPTVAQPAQLPSQAAQTAQAPAPACNNCPTPAVQHLQPYIAKTHSTNVQTRADGTTVTTVTEGQTWRDADGRVRGESIRTPPNGAPSHFNSIYDPVTRIIMSWTVGDPSADKIVGVHRLPQPASQPTPISPQTAPRYPPKSESLPPQTILGFNVPGTRNTYTIPAGHQGNDHDVTITTEYWYAPSLGIQLRNITDDPINGKTTTEVTDIQFVDPDPALFQPPDGYQLKEGNPDASGIRQVGGGVTGPKVIYMPPPEIPKEAASTKIYGTTTVTLIVDAQGKPVDVHIAKSIASATDGLHPAVAQLIDQAALNSVKQYKFIPAKEDGKPVAVILNVQVNFQTF
jgi:TonB family protein